MVVANAGVCECAFVVHGWCARDVQVSEARVECTFLANDAACLPLVRAVIQLRCCGNVSLGVWAPILCCVWWFLNGMWVSAEFYSLSLIA